MPIHSALADQLSNFKHIPTLPHILLQLIKTCNEESGSLKDVSRIIGNDTALTTRVLKLVNSAYYGNKYHISNVDSAVGLLGTNTIKNIAICSSVHEVFQTVNTKTGFNIKQFWGHSLKCAILSKLIARNRNFPNPEEAFLAGLLHDIGKIILWLNFPQPYADLIEAHKGKPESFLAGENQFVGAGHAEIGAWLLDKWNFQSFIADAVRYHHYPQNRLQDALPLVKCLFVANTVCKNSGRNFIDGLGTARDFFGFNPVIVEEMLTQADAELKAVAESLNIGIEHTKSNGLIKESVSAENDRQKQIDLIKEVRDRSLLLGSMENLLAATTETEIWKESFQGLHSLFDISLVLFFIFDSEKQGLRGVTFPDNMGFSVIKDVFIPFQMEKSLMIECLQTQKIADSFTHSTDIVHAVIDEQIIRLLGKEGMVCIPMIGYGEKIGTMVLGLDRREFSQLTTQIKPLKMLVNQTAVAIRVHRSKESRIREIQLERYGASSTLAQKVIHEVNNPLGIIKNYLKILGLKLAAADMSQDEIQILNEEIDRISQILHTLNSSAENWVRRTEAVDVNAVLSDILTITKEPLLDHFNVKIHFDPDSDLPAVMADKNSLKQVFINLMKNAFEALPDGGNLHIQTRHVSSRLNDEFSDNDVDCPGFVDISFRDDGPGIPDEIKTRLFEPYIGSKNGDHAGLGLSIVHAILQSQNGTITCESESGKGTTFWIELPIASGTNNTSRGEI
jgi:putative nucleotidyltransferase with HDIG domain